MPEYDDELRGVLFPNTDKKSERHPDFSGKVQVEGTDYRIAAWKRNAKSDGRPFLSLSLSVDEPREIEDPEGALEL